MIYCKPFDHKKQDKELSLPCISGIIYRFITISAAIVRYAASSVIKPKFSLIVLLILHLIYLLLNLNANISPNNRTPADTPTSARGTVRLAVFEPLGENSPP